MAKRIVIILALTVALVTGLALAVIGTPPSLAQVGSGEGLRAQIINVEIPGDRHPVVTFRLTSATGAPLRLEDMDANSVRFILTHVRQDPRSGLAELMSYTVGSATGRPYVFEGESKQPAVATAPQAVYDSGGTFSAQGNGQYTYKFGAALPAEFDRAALHRLGMQATRQARRWVANDFRDFTPNGQVAEGRQIVTTAACNNCHDLITAHGGQRYQVELCATCHTPQTIDPETNETQDLKVLVHKIHRGHDLPSVQAGDPYYIVGFRQVVHDYSHVVFPQDVRDCTSCHNGAQGDFWKQNPSAAACGSCHDNVNFQTGAGHVAGAQPDSSCATCHPADGPEFGPSVAGAHTIPERSAQLRGVTFQVTGVSNAAPGQQPVISFNIKDRAGNPIDPANMSRLAFTLAGTTAEYTTWWNESALGKVTVVSPEEYRFTYPRALPANAGGTWTVQVEGYINSQVKDPRGQPVTNAAGAPLVVRDAGFDQALDFAVGGGPVLPRKEVVSDERCNSCHGALSIHGGNRQNIDNCVLCHNPVTTDAAVRPADAGAPESIDFKVLIHKIHTGEELTEKPYIVYGFRGSVHQYDNVLYPGDRRNCEACHVPGSYVVDHVRNGALPVSMPRQGDGATVAPISAACVSCHDSVAAKAHAEVNTASGNRESCIVCHSENREWPVSESHSFSLPVAERPR